MPKKEQPQQVYKTESELKQEALEKQNAEAQAEAAKPKSALQQKRENYWYHYKWHTIAGVFIVCLLVIFVKDMFFQTKPDMTMIVLTEGYIDDASLERLCSYMEQQATDLNGDGKVVISRDLLLLTPEASDETQGDIPAPDLTGGQQEYATMMKLVTLVTVASDPVYLLDEPSYNRIIKMGQAETDSPDTDNVFIEFRLPVENLEADGLEAFSGMSFYIRISCTDEVYYEYCVNLLEQLQ